MVAQNIKVGIIGGTGLEDLVTEFSSNFQEIKKESLVNNFGIPSSNLYEGNISGVNVILLSRHGTGPKRLIPSAVNYRANIEALRSIGCTHTLASTAGGSLTDSIARGQLVIPDSFIDRTVHRKGTFFDGTSDVYSGSCYMPMEPAYDTRTSDILEKAAKEVGVSIKRGGTVVTIEGPRFSSKAESNLYRQWGAHIVNMTTCPEVCLAREAGILYASVAMVTDYDSWKDSNDQVQAYSVIEIFKSNVRRIVDLFIKAIELIGKENWNQDINNLNQIVKNNTL